MAKKLIKKVVTVRTVTPLKKAVIKNGSKNNKPVQKKSNSGRDIKIISTGKSKGFKPKTNKTRTGTTTGQKPKINSKKGLKVTRKAKEITYNKAALKQLRNTIRKKDGTFLNKKHYLRILKKVESAKTQDESDNILIELRNKNPKLRYFKKSDSDVLHFQTGNFIDRLSGVLETKKAKAKGKLKSENIFTGELKKGAKIIITDLKGDSYQFTSVSKAGDLFYKNNTIINKVVDLVRDVAIKATKSVKTKEALKKKKKGTGTYFKVPESVTSNSEGKVIAVRYDFSKLSIQGTDIQRAENLLSQLIENYNSDLTPNYFE